MIELVFIIVILGILASIAVPKMAASRTDAKVVSIKQDIGTIMQAIPAMAMSKGVDKITGFSSAVTLTSTNWKGYVAASEIEKEVNGKKTKVPVPPSLGDKLDTTIYSSIGVGGKETGVGDEDKKNKGVPNFSTKPCVTVTLDTKNKQLVINVVEDTICQKIAPKGETIIPLAGKNVVF